MCRYIIIGLAILVPLQAIAAEHPDLPRKSPLTQQLPEPIDSNITLVPKHISLVKFDKGQPIRADAIVSPDNQRIAYIEFEGSTGGRVVVNGVPGKLYDSFSGIGCVFSPNGQRLAYAAGIKGRKNFLVLDGVEGVDGYTGIGYPTFSPDSRQLAYKAWDNNAKKEVIFLNGEKCGEYDRIVGTNDGKGLVFSPDGKRLGYVAVNGHKSFVVIDGKEGKYYDLTISGFVFSQDSKHVMYNARRDGKGIIVKDEIEIAESNSLQSSVCSPDCNRMACIFKEGDKEYVVVDGNQGKQYDNITELKFGPNGKRFAYAAWSGRTMYAVVDGKEQKNYRWVMNITFSPDSKRVAYSAGVMREYIEQFVVVDGIEGKRYKSQDPYGSCKISPPVFSPDSKHVAYVVEMRDKSWVVLDDVEGSHYDEVRKNTLGGWDNWDKSLAFSPDGKIAYWAKRDNIWRIVVAGVESEEYWGYLPNGNLVFESPNRLHSMAFRDWEIMRVEIEINED